MSTKRNEASKSKQPYIPILLVATATIVLFLLFTPKISARIFPFLSDYRLQSFIKSTQSTNSIDPQSYWEFREFYSPGSFEVNKTGLDDTEVLSLVSDLGISWNTDTIGIPFLKFTSPNTQSVDYLTESQTLSNILLSESIDKAAVLFQTDTDLIIKSDQSTIAIIFIKSPEDMKKANGFFDYRDVDKKLTENKHWMNITLITR